MPGTECRALSSVLRRLLDVIDDDIRHLTLFRIELQPELLLQRRKKGWTFGVGRRGSLTAARRRQPWHADAGGFVRHPLQFEVAQTGQTGFVDHSAAQNA